MYYYEVAPRAIIRSDADTFTFHNESELAIGQLVSISIGKRTLTGVVTRAVNKPTYTTKPISAVIESTPLPVELIATAEWLKTYYQTPLGVVLQTMLPSGLTTKRRGDYKPPITHSRDRTPIVFNADQKRALTSIQTDPPETTLLHGVTGSGKTQLYIEAAKNALKNNASAIILVPEIALTGQIVAEFSAHFPDIIVTHSRQTAAQRHLAWQEALTAKTPRVVIGPRSALFMPLKKIGLIAIDEVHEPSYKQEQAPRYSSIQLASVLSHHHKARLILGSATPSVSDYYLAEQRKKPIVELPKPARTVTPPHVSIVDMTKKQSFSRHRFLSDKLLESIEQAISRHKQVLLFHNRRGSSPMTVCTHCGWQALCPTCYLPLILHADSFNLRCHVCGHTEPVPTSCPDCGHAEVIHKGIGTKLIESELARLFPKATMARFDGDTTTEQSLDARYQEVYDGDISILIGTQSIAKGLDLPHLETVGVIQADAGLNLPDFSSSERTFQLIAQVVGRVGRSDHETQIIVQSYQPTHPAITDGIAQNYRNFYERTIAERQRALFPPFVYLLKVTCAYKTEAAAIRNIKKFAQHLKTELPELTLFGPTPAFHERAHDTYRWQLVVKSPRREPLLAAAALVPAKNFTAELDPISLL